MNLKPGSLMNLIIWRLNYFNMNLVIDKSNIESLISSVNDADYKDCMQILRQGVNLILNFDKSEINPSTREGQNLISWLRSIITDKGFKSKHPEWRKKFDSSSLKTNFVTSLSSDEKRDIYLFDNLDVVSKIKEKGAILIGAVGDEISLLRSIILNDTERPACQIGSWSNYIPCLPVTDIIICDNHYFKHKDVYNSNDNELIRALCVLPKQSPVHCIIITKRDEIDPAINVQDELVSLKSLIKDLTDSTKSSVTIVSTYRTHDRNALTNYFRLKCGSCYHLKDNGLKKDVTAEIKTHANLTNEAISLHLLSEYQQIINENANDIIGDKKSNFLKFPD